MARKKKDGRFINYYIDRGIYERLERYAEDKAQPVTAALEHILEVHLDRYEAELARQQCYCPGCHSLVWDNRCPGCGKKWLEPPRPDDYCFLTQREALWAGVLEDCLRKNRIPFLTQNTLGAGLTARLGAAMESVRFYVPFARLEDARTLCGTLFAEQIPQEEDIP